MRPSAISRSSVSRAISRRTPSKLESTTADGVSSMITSTPVSFSRARMLRPSRPMIRPFISSLGSSTRRVVDSLECFAASRCIATERMLRARRSASARVSSSICCSRSPAWCLASCSTSASSSCLRLRGGEPGEPLELAPLERALPASAPRSPWSRLRSRSSSAWSRRSRSARCDGERLGLAQRPLLHPRDLLTPGAQLGVGGRVGRRGAVDLGGVTAGRASGAVAAGGSAPGTPSARPGGAASSGDGAAAPGSGAGGGRAIASPG